MSWPCNSCTISTRHMHTDVGFCCLLKVLEGFMCVAAPRFLLNRSGLFGWMKAISPHDLWGSEPISIVLPISPEGRLGCNVAKDWSCHAISLGVTQLSPWWDVCWHVSGRIMACFPTCPGGLWVCQRRWGACNIFLMWHLRQKRVSWGRIRQINLGWQLP